MKVSSGKALDMIEWTATKYVNVGANETVKFESNGREFALNFAGIRSGYDLSALAPQGALDHEVRVYVMLSALVQRLARPDRETESRGQGQREPNIFWFIAAAATRS